jgi:hypothetical protein
MQPRDQLPGFFVWQTPTLLKIFAHFWFDCKWVNLLKSGLTSNGYVVRYSSAVLTKTSYRQVTGDER